MYIPTVESSCTGNTQGILLMVQLLFSICASSTNGYHYQVCTVMFNGPCQTGISIIPTGVALFLADSGCGWKPLSTIRALGKLIISGLATDLRN